MCVCLCVCVCVYSRFRKDDEVEDYTAHECLLGFVHVCVVCTHVRTTVHLYTHTYLCESNVFLKPERQRVKFWIRACNSLLTHRGPYQ